jgi:small subunit ribosomal protein S16
MVRIRLRRTGAKNNPAYRVVVADQNSPRDGAFIETIGHYLPTRQPAIVEIDEEKARKWLAKGAQPSETVASLLKHKGILTGKAAAAAAATTPATTEATAPAATEAPAAEATAEASAQ